MKLSELQGQKKRFKLSELQGSAPKKRYKLSELKSRAESQGLPESRPSKLDSVKDSLVNAVEASVPLVGLVRHPERLPMAGQIAGGMFGGYPGSVAGATAGQAVNQLSRGLTGKGFKFGEIPAEAARTATIEGIFRGAGKAMPWTANKFMNWTLRPGNEVLEKNPTFGLDVLRQGVRGTFGQMKNKASSLADTYEGQIQNLIKNRREMVSTRNVADKLNPEIDKYMRIGDKSAIKSGEDILDVDTALRSKGDLISLQEANQLKRDLYGELPKGAFNADPSISSATQDARKMVALGLADEMNQAVPAVKPINQKYGQVIEALNSIPKAAAQRAKHTPLPYFEGAGGLYGFGTGQMWIPAAIAARRLLSTPFGASMMASGLDYASKPIARKFGAIASAQAARKMFGEN